MAAASQDDGGSTQNFVSLDPSQNAYATDAVGMPDGDPAPSAPTVIDMVDPDTTPAPAGFMGSIENFGSSVVTHVESGVSTVYGGAKTVVGDVVGGAEGVVSKTVGIATGGLSSIAMDIAIVVAVAGIALYFIMKSGNVKVNAIV